MNKTHTSSKESGEKVTLKNGGYISDKVAGLLRVNLNKGEGRSDSNFCQQPGNVFALSFNVTGA